MLSARIDGGHAHAASPHPVDAAARAVRPRISEIGRDERGRGFAAIHPRKQQRRRAFQNIQRRAAQKIGEAHEHSFLAPTDGQDQAAVRIKFDAKSGRPSLTAQPREQALEQRTAARHELRLTRRFHSDERRGAIREKQRQRHRPRGEEKSGFSAQKTRGEKAVLASLGMTIRQNSRMLGILPSSSGAPAAAQRLFWLFPHRSGRREFLRWRRPSCLCKSRAAGHRPRAFRE